MSDDVPTAAEVAAIAQQVSNWGRWGPDDERGTLNLITSQHVREAASLIRDGVTVPCTRPIPVAPAPDNPRPAQHFIVAAGDEARHGRIPGMEISYDYFGIAPHGGASTHLDALCHLFIDGRMYNGFDASLVRSDGALKNSITAMRDAIVSRGVLLDIPALHGVEWLERDVRIGVDDLTAAEVRQGVSVSSGDVLIVATGRDDRRAAKGAWRHPDEGGAGLSPACIPWLHERGVAALGCDGVSDALPSGIDGWPMPIHQIVIVMMGCPLIDNMRLTELVAACAERQRWAFHFTLAPLHLEGGTASPVTPIATF